MWVNAAGASAFAVGQKLLMCKTRHIFSILAMGLAVALAPSPSSAQQTVKAGDKGAALIAAGETALKKGQYKVAVQQFGKALRSGDLADAQVAKALYRRGVAHEKAGQPAQAIADITSALFLPALSGAERAKAYLSRGRAYEAVGMTDFARSDISRARSGGVSEQQIARADQPAQSGAGSRGGPAFATSVEPAGGQAAGPSFATSVEPSGSGGRAPSFATRSDAPSSASGRQRVASFGTETRAGPSSPDEIPSFRTTTLPQESSASTRRTTTQTATARPAGNAAAGWDTSAAAQQPVQAEQKTEESGSGMSRFFGNLWANARGGSDKKKQTASAPAPATTSTPPPWTQTTSGARQLQPSWSAQVSSPGQASPPARPPGSIQPAGAPSGASGYRIQLAALRSDAEAQATWKRLQGKHPDLLGGRQPNIVRTDLGGLGTFYRVQLGPFADKTVSQKLCNDFKRGGLDCFLLAP